MILWESNQMPDFDAKVLFVLNINYNFKSLYNTDNFELKYY